MLVVQQLPHRPFFLPLLKRFQEVNALEIGMTGLEDDKTEPSMPCLREEVPSWKQNRPDRYKRLAEYQGAVIFPYDASCLHNIRP